MNICLDGSLDTQPLAAQVSHATLLDALKFNARQAPASLVYRFMGHEPGDEQDLDNAGLVACVSRFARVIDRLSPAKEEGAAVKVVLVLPQGRDFVAAYFGCIAAQAIAVPSFPPKNRRQAERLKLVLLDLGDCVVLGDRASLHSDLAELRRDDDLKRVQWVSTEEVRQEQPGSLDNFHARPDAIAMLQYTSGSTGQPRGVAVSNANLVANSELIKQCFAHHRPHRRSVIWLPPYHDMGLIGGVIQPVHAGFAALLMPTSLFVRHPFRWLKAIDDFKGTSSGGPNFAFQMCVTNVRDRDLQNLDLSSWDVAFCGAEPIQYQTMVDFSHRFAAAGFRPSALYPCYGMAETTLMVSGKHALEDFRALPVDAHALAKGWVATAGRGTAARQTLVSCGEAHPSLDVRIVDPALGIERAESEIGEIWVSGPSVAIGYWGHAEKTRQTFDQTLLGRAERYLRTGDLGFLNDGQLYITGRMKEVLIVRGANYYPQELERECLLACPEINHLRAAAFSVPSAAHEKVVLALEVPNIGLDHEGVVKRINSRLIETFGIRANVVLFVPRRTIKTTTSGKVQRLILRKEYLEGGVPIYETWEEQSREGFAAHLPISFDATDEEAVVLWVIDRIAGITRLPPEQIQRDDCFADLALDSVASLDLLAELDRTHGIVIEPEVLYKRNTPELLAQEIFKTARLVVPTREGVARAAD